MAREATAADLPWLLAMARKIHAGSGYGEWAAFDGPSMLATLEAMIASDTAALLVIGDPPEGVLAIEARPASFNADALLAQESFWWMEPGARGQGRKLLEAAEAWARKRGAVVMDVSFAAGFDPRLKSFYERSGYRAAEYHFAKGL